LKVWYPDCRPENAAFKLEQLKSASQFGGASPNDWIRYMGGEVNEDNPAYSSGYVPANLVPLDAPETTEDDLPSDPDAANEAEENVVADGPDKTGEKVPKAGDLNDGKDAPDLKD
jgi:hypothetical protein